MSPSLQNVLANTRKSFIFAKNQFVTHQACNSLTSLIFINFKQWCILACSKFTPFIYTIAETYNLYTVVIPTIITTFCRHQSLGFWPVSFYPQNNVPHYDLFHIKEKSQKILPTKEMDSLYMASHTVTVVYNFPTCFGEYNIFIHLRVSRLGDRSYRFVDAKKARHSNDQTPDPPAHPPQIHK